MERFFVSAQTHRWLKTALATIVIITLYVQVAQPALRTHTQENVLAMAVGPLATSTLTNHLLTVAMLVAVCFIFNEMQKQFVDRADKTWIACLAIIVSKAVSVITHVLYAVVWSNDLYMAIHSPLTWVCQTISAITSLVATVSLTWLCYTFIRHYMGRLKVAGWVQAACLTTGIVGTPLLGYMGSYHEWPLVAGRIVFIFASILPPLFFYRAFAVHTDDATPMTET